MLGSLALGPFPLVSSAFAALPRSSGCDLAFKEFTGCEWIDVSMVDGQLLRKRYKRSL